MTAAPDYLRHADALAGDIAAGRLPAGTRLPPQRDFAYRHGIAVSTASRVYAELVRRGLVSGEVGRGTYVRAVAPGGGIWPPSHALAEPSGAPVDLELNVAILPGQDRLVADAVAAVLRPETAAAALRPVTSAASPAARDLVAGVLARGDWRPDPSALRFAGNGRQAIAAALAAIARPGDRVAVEALTYPVVKAIAQRLGITLVPIALDGDGIDPTALARLHRGTPLAGLYLQPSLHNPLGLTMPPSRREALAAVLAETGLIAIEDAVYGFLAGDDRPLAAFAPGRTIVIDSLSKRLAPGLTLGFVAPPAALAERVTGAIRAGTWLPAGVALAAGLHCLGDGSARRLAEAKCRDAAERQALARGILDGLAVRGDARAYHLWLELPVHWRADAFAAAASRRGIALAPAGAFAVTPGHAPNAVRLALAAPAMPTLAEALTRLRALAEGDPAECGIE